MSLKMSGRSECDNWGESSYTETFASPNTKNDCQLALRQGQKPGINDYHYGLAPTGVSFHEISRLSTLPSA